MKSNDATTNPFDKLPYEAGCILPETHRHYKGVYSWENLPNGTLTWVAKDKRWVDIAPYKVSAIPGGIYAVPKLQLPDVPKNPEPQLDILEEAIALIRGDRAASYGEANISFGRIAALWTSLLKHKLSEDQSVSSVDVARLMIAMKLSRSISSDKRDNWTDIAGYASLAAEIEATEGLKTNEQSSPHT